MGRLMRNLNGFYKYLFVEKSTFFGSTPENKDGFDPIKGLATLPFHAAAAPVATAWNVGKWLAKHRPKPKPLPASHLPPAAQPVKPKKVPPPPPPPTRKELIEKATRHHAAEVAACRQIADEDLREQALAKIEIDFRQEIARILYGQATPQ